MKSKACFLTLLLTLPLFSCATTKPYLVVFGYDYKSDSQSLFSILSKEYDRNYISCFVKNKDRYEDTLYYLENDPLVKYQEHSQKVSYYLTRSSYIFLSFSYLDLLRNAKIADDNFIYSHQDFSHDLERFDYYFNGICSTLAGYDISKRVYCLSVFDIYGCEESKEKVARFNEIIETKADEYDYNFVDISPFQITTGSITNSDLHTLANLINSQVD